MSSSKKMKTYIRNGKNNISLQQFKLDESTDVVDTSQMSVFIRMVFSDFTIKDLLKFIPIK
ncbi:unnamed protein product [Acanthoscelides obtectus]|uniref:Uncharacterized protein n=1 Tax=Acanthoscelides obtectus TaxID=200917 RepID=A0A9P0KJV3_ACAOB|nr:unnamed protein product [Acanthoscelides obtectus]CAK1687943.1 hypothetical protein AOBTE_LOCUS36466 [Acanthoscelides obtectus]